MNRRDFIKFASAVSLAAALPEAAWADDVDAAEAASDGVAFSEEWLFRQAENLARQPFEAPRLSLPSELADLDRRQYEAIRYRPEASVWRNENSNFNLRFFHTGFQYKTPVAIYLIEGDRARRFPYSVSQFAFGEPLNAPPSDSQAGFSGIDVLGPIDDPGEKASFLTFQGASFFRAIASDQVFGAVARAISVNTAQPQGEEFPVFRSLWIRKPAPRERSITIYALLDGPSLAGAYKFDVEPGRSTIIDVTCSLFPRRDLGHVGIAPVNSMYFFGTADASRPDDYRPNVHSSEGLRIWNASDEWIWRPLINPEQLQYSVFLDRTPKGFGLMQRKRAFQDFEDITAQFDDRPSLWITPRHDWGDGAVDLIEVPSSSEIYNNIIAFWRPRRPLQAGARHDFRYRLTWGWGPPFRSPQFIVSQTRTGQGGSDDRRVFAVDFISERSCDNCNLPSIMADVRAGEGEIADVSVRYNPAIGGQRVNFEFRPGAQSQTDLRCQLKRDDQVISETWVYRWTS